MRRDFGFLTKLLLHGFWNCILHVQRKLFGEFNFIEKLFVIFFLLRARTFRTLEKKNWPRLSKLRSMCPVNVLRNKNVCKKSSSSYNYFQLLIVKIADFGENFTTCFSICILEIQKIFMMKIVIANTGNFKFFPVFEWKHSGFLSGSFSGWLSKLLFTCQDEMIWE